MPAIRDKIPRGTLLTISAAIYPIYSVRVYRITITSITQSRINIIWNYNRFAGSYDCKLDGLIMNIG